MLHFRLTFILFIALLGFGAIAQNQYNNWYFGFNAGITFNSGNPVSVNNGALTTDEGCASISDGAGNLLFYTNGESVYNRNHQLMQNGNSIGGHFSSAQSALIVPFPKDSSRYYVFTTPAQLGAWGAGSTTGFAYSVIDISANNGDGQVISKNTVLTDSVCEYMTAIRHKNKKDVWVVVHKWNRNEYLAYLVTCNGIQQPIVSPTGLAPVNDAGGSYLAAIGCMKISRDGSWIARAWTNFTGTYGIGNLEICDFDNSTGVIGNPVNIVRNLPGYDCRSYGVEFSPSSQLLYYSESGLFNGIGYSKIFQYDVTVPAIETTQTEIANQFLAMGTLQSGPDNKIYIARLNGSKHISIIHNPDIPGTGCGFDNAGISIDPNISTWGLPNNWDTFPVEEEYNLFAFTDTTLCEPNQLLLLPDYPLDGSETYLWNDGSDLPTLLVSQSGVYWLNLISGCDTIKDTVTVKLNSNNLFLGEDIYLCENESTILSVKNHWQNITWSNGSNQSFIQVNEPGSYAVEVTDSAGCRFTDDISIEHEKCECTAYFPRAFTPNDDGRNELIGIVADCNFEEFTLKIYNRWGQLVFETNNSAEKWDGTFINSDAEQQVYAYTLLYSWRKKGVEEEISKRGTFTLLR